MSLCMQARVRLPSRGQVRIPPPIDDRYVAKYCRAKNVRGSAAAEGTRASNGPGTSTLGPDPYQQAVCNYNWDWMAVLATILTLWLADKSGRRLLLIVSSSAMALSLLVVSISFYLKEYISPDSDLYATLSLVSVAGVVVMVIAFSLGLGAMPWIIMSEILPINIKGLAGSFATLANWFFSWLVTLTANLLLDWSSGGTFTIYTAVCVFTAGFVAIWVPETKGKTLEEIQQFFR
ncbi:sugar transporter ERD6-like 6 [Lathyrus oleraceus]|uniref:sugar transporter ERD6-like 6 n=1 Tax=Pisum sativum TaxID=3888 RepID=UPI0021CE0AD6|nr:sugar transporter ERD6-like 6 [Pisum sativum]